MQTTRPTPKHPNTRNRHTRQTPWREYHTRQTDTLDGHGPTSGILIDALDGHGSFSEIEPDRTLHKTDPDYDSFI
jgi:hypothetical protein